MLPISMGIRFEELGTIQILQSNINTSGKGGGAILIRGGRLIVDASAISAKTGDISLDGTSIRITHAAGIVTATETSANAGHIILKASGDIEMEIFPQLLVPSQQILWETPGISRSPAVMEM